MSTPCTCDAVMLKYGRQFPHRYTRECFEREREFRDNRDRGTGKTLSEINAEMLALFDATEAQAINSSKW